LHHRKTYSSHQSLSIANFSVASRVDGKTAATISFKYSINEIPKKLFARVLKPVRAKYAQKGLTDTKSGTLLKNHIPICTGTWDSTEPGFMEADTLAHSGNSLAGDLVWSLTLTD